MASSTGNGDIGGFTTGELQMASWWVRNGVLVRKLGYGFLIALAALFWGYVIWSLLDAYAISYPRESKITQAIAVNQQLLTALESDRPQNVAASDVSVFAASDNRADMEVELTNPNEQWWVDFNYHFNLSGEATPVRTGYVLPHSKQIVTELGYTPKAKGGRVATFVVDTIHWHRVDPNFVGASYTDFAQNRLALNFKDISYSSDIVLGTKRVGQTSFTLQNTGSFGFWSVDLIIRLYRGNSVAAMTKLNVQNVSPGESRPIQIVWLDNLPSISKTEIIPQVNLLDPSVYLPTQYFK